MATSRIAEHVGRVLGDRYRLSRPLGSGASAHVYVAEDVNLRRRVAVKLLHSGLAGDASFQRRFQAEARVVAALRHPNIVRVYDWGEDDGAPFLVMELLEGGSLRSLLDRGSLLSPAQAALTGAGAAHALDYAHRRGLIHRDIKPANLLFDEEGRVCVADFGLARALAEATWTEPAGAVLGTARYAAPEQVQGAGLDGRADVYALALVLVEAVTGRVPFAADTTIGTLMARIHQPLTGPTELGPLAPVVARAGTSDPADRIGAADMARQLEAVIPTLPAPVPLALASPLVTGDLDGEGDITEVPGPPKPTLFDGEALDDHRGGSGRGRSGRGAGGSSRASSRAEGNGGHGRDGSGAEAGRRGRHWGRWVLALLLAMAVVAGGAFAIARARKPSHPVPLVLNDSQAQAAQALAAVHLRLNVASRPYDDTVPLGKIIRQRPQSGRLREGSVVSVDVSNGLPPVPVPDLAGLTQDQAAQRLVGAGLTLGKVSSRIDATIKAGLVIDWTGRGGQLTKLSPVELVISSGPPTVAIPDVHSKSFADATALLTPAHLTGVEADEFSDTVPKGQVIATNPPAGTTVTVGSQVTVRVSKGPDLVAVPDVRNMTVDAATKSLEATGFSVSGVIGSPDRPVYITNPVAGVLIKRGSAVKLYTS